MEVGLAAQIPGFISAARRRLREGETRAGYRPNPPEAAAFTPCKGVSRACHSRLGVLPALARVAKVGHAFRVGVLAQHVVPVSLINPSESGLPNKAFKLARFTRWDARTARPLISR